MKKIFLAATAFVVAASAQMSAQTKVDPMVSASTGFYVGVHGGYNFGIAKGATYSNVNYSGTGTAYKSNQFSYGQGANVGIDLGYMFNRNVGAELGIDYLKGSKFTAESISTGSYVEEITQYGQMLQLSPKVVVRANPAKVTPYAKFGLSLGLMPETTEEYTARDSGDNYKEVLVKEGGTPVGVTGALGIDYAINTKMSLFGEIRSTAMSYKPTKGTYTEAVWNGDNDLQYWDYDEIHIEYVDEYNSTENAGTSTATKSERITEPFSNVGLNIGFRYSF